MIEYLKDVAELVQTSEGEVITASQMLERFLFSPNQQYAPINKLSGGERRRLFLLRVLLSAPNVLILDEPTNDLDVQTLSVLEEYLEEFNGCVIVVSHDRYFLDRTVEKIFALEGGGEVREYPGNYSVYLEHKKDEETAIEKPPEPKVSVSKTVTNKPRKMSFKEKRELETLETRIPELETEKSAIEQKLYRNPPSGFSEVQSLSEQLASLDQQIETSTIRWMELSEMNE